MDSRLLLWEPLSHKIKKTYKGHLNRSTSLQVGRTSESYGWQCYGVVREVTCLSQPCLQPAAHLPAQVPHMHCPPSPLPHPTPPLRPASWCTTACTIRPRSL